MGEFLALEVHMQLEPELAVVRAGDLALVSGCWKLTGTGPDGEPVTMSGRTTDVARQQPDGTWRRVIDVPFGIG
jgi:ketosteroid isomerase-like protein